MEQLVNLIVSAMVGAVIGYITAYFTGITALKKGMQVLLRCRLRQDYYYFKRNGLTLEQKTDYEAMYEAYHNLGQNGVMTSCYNDLVSFEVMSSKENR